MCIRFRKPLCRRPIVAAGDQILGHLHGYRGVTAIGVGSDGLAVVQRSDAASVRMRIINSDGSESEMSGNGIRLFAKFVLDRKLAPLEAGESSFRVGSRQGEGPIVSTTPGPESSDMMRRGRPDRVSGATERRRSTPRGP